MRLSKHISPLLLSIPLLMMGITAQAQEAAPAKAAATSGNELSILLGVIALVLALVIWGMGQVLVTISRQALEKSKASKMMAILFVAGFSLLSLTAGAQDAAAGAADAVATKTNYGSLDGSGFWLFTSVILIEVVTIFFLLFSIRRIQAELLPQTAAKPRMLKEWWDRLDKKFFTKAVAVEREADVMLDHDYDGIKELDNALPPWWKWGFIFTVVVGIIYLINFHVTGYGQNPTQEYEEEMAKATAAKEAYEAKMVDKVDEKALKMPDAGGIAKGKEIFESVCWTCHGKLGEGGIGPNLTDDYWIHKGSLTDVYLSIKHGYPDKGMQAWEKNYSPKEINDLAGYIKSLKGTNPPNGKAAQGDLFTEDATGAAKDSTAKAGGKADSTATTQSAPKADSTVSKK